MKTPREILLARHESAEPRLDELRGQVVGSLGARSVSRPLWWRVAWIEIVGSARPAWAGIAAVGLVALGLNLSVPWPDAPPAPALVVSPAKRADMRRARIEFIAELLGPPAVRDDVPESSPADRERRRSDVPRSLWPV